MIFRFLSRDRVETSTIVAYTITAIWVALSALYVHSSIGWFNVLTLLPHELGAVLTGVFAPLAFLWLCMAYVGRGTVLNDTANALRADLRRLTHPSKESEERVQEVAASLRRLFCFDRKKRS